MKSKIIPVLILSMCLSGCEKNKEPAKHIDSNFIDTYIEIIYLQEQSALSAKAYQDSVRQILHKNQFTEQTYSEMIRKYQTHPEDWEKFLQKVLNRIDQSDTSRNDSKNFSQQNLYEQIKKNR